MITQVYVYREGLRYYYSAWSNGQFDSSGQLPATLEDLAVMCAEEWFPGAWVHRGERYVPASELSDWK